MDERQKIIDQVIAILQKTGKMPSKTILKQIGITENKLYQYFANWQDLIRSIDPNIIQRMKEKRAIDELQRILIPPNLSYVVFKNHGGNISCIRAAFATWNDAIAAAFSEDVLNTWKKLRYGKNKKGHKKKTAIISQQKLIKQMEEYYLSHNKTIRSEDFTKGKLSICKAIAEYGGWKQLIKKSIIWQYEKEKVLNRFKQEASEIIQEYGHFSMHLHKAKPGTLHHTKLRDMFGSLAQLRTEAGLDVPIEAYTYRGAYTEQEYSDFLWKIYNKYGFISCSLIKNEPNHIQFHTITDKFGSLEAACKHFGVPYKAPAHRSKFYFEIETKACNYLQIPCIQEKTWPWLRYKSRLRCDLFFPLINLVIEIDGPQHYKNFRFFHETNEKYYTALKRDQIKNKELPKHGIDLIRIDSRNVKQIEQILRPFREKRDLIYDLCAF